MDQVELWTERVIDSPEGNCTGSSKDWVMIEFEVPSNKLSLIRGTEVSDELFFCMNFESTKQWVDLELTSAEIGGELGSRVEERLIWREWGSERIDALSQISSIGAQEGIMESSVCAEVWGLLTIFSNHQILLVSPWPGQHGLWPWQILTLGNYWPYDQHHHKPFTSCCWNIFAFPEVLAYHLF